MQRVGPGAAFKRQVASVSRVPWNRLSDALHQAAQVRHGLARVQAQAAQIGPFQRGKVSARAGAKLLAHAPGKRPRQGIVRAHSPSASQSGFISGVKEKYIARISGGSSSRNRSAPEANPIGTRSRSETFCKSACDSTRPAAVVSS